MPSKRRRASENMASPSRPNPTHPMRKKRRRSQPTNQNKPEERADEHPRPNVPGASAFDWSYEAEEHDEALEKFGTQATSSAVTEHPAGGSSAPGGPVYKSFPSPLLLPSSPTPPVAGVDIFKLADDVSEAAACMVDAWQPSVAAIGDLALLNRFWEMHRDITALAAELLDMACRRRHHHPVPLVVRLPDYSLVRGDGAGPGTALSDAETQLNPAHGGENVYG